MGYETCGDNGGTNRDGEPCGQPAGAGTDFDTGKCKHHRGTSPDGTSHEGNDYGKKHGAFSEHFRSDLTDDETDALEAVIEHLRSIDDERSIAAEVAAEALLKYKRSADSRFLREARQWFADFNLLPNEDELNVSGEGGGALEVIVNREEYNNDE
jgi:hypothetical protein